jgi:hypothetical protein
VILWVMAGLQAAQHLWSLTGMAVGGGPFAWLAVWWWFLSPAMPACLGLALWLMANMAQQVESMWIAINAHRAEVPVVARAVPLPATARTPQPVVSGAASDIVHDARPTEENGG